MGEYYIHMSITHHCWVNRACKSFMSLYSLGPPDARAVACAVSLSPGWRPRRFLFRRRACALSCGMPAALGDAFNAGTLKLLEILHTYNYMVVNKTRLAIETKTAVIGEKHDAIVGLHWLKILLPFSLCCNRDKITSNPTRKWKDKINPIKTDTRLQHSIW